MLGVKWAKLRSQGGWRIVVGILLIINFALLIIGFTRQGLPIGQTQAIVLEGGLRSDLVAIERPWESSSDQVETSASSRLIDLKNAQFQLDEAIQSGQSKVETELPPPAICYQWGPLLPEQVQRVSDSLQGWTGQTEIVENRAVVGYITYVPKVAVDAGATLQRLQELGVTDLFYMQTVGPIQGAISLGIFRDEASAEQHKQEMLAKGVPEVQIDPRFGPTRTYFKLLGNEAEVAELRRYFELNRQGSLSLCTKDIENS